MSNYMYIGASSVDKFIEIINRDFIQFQNGLLSQCNLNSTQVGSDKVVDWTTHTTSPVKLLGHSQATSEADFWYATLF